MKTFALFAALFFLSAILASAQKIAVLTPEKTAESLKFAERLENSLTEKFKVLDASLSETAYLSANAQNPFNMTTDEAHIIGAAIGCDYFLIVKAETLQRFSLVKDEYFEAYAVIYTISARTGRLGFWRLLSFDGKDAQTAEKSLFGGTDNFTKELFEKIPAIAQNELSEKLKPTLEEIPAENSPNAKNFRPPLPFKRISPPYTQAARLYGVAATVDIEIDIDETGRVKRTEILRWAGFGLDESVTDTVRQMNWRPAERDRKFLPIRILLRYNFKKIEKEE